MSNGRLKPCLFCRRAEMLDTKFDEARFLKPFCWIVVCSGCGASGPNRSTEDAAIREWNAPERQCS